VWIFTPQFYAESGYEIACCRSVCDVEVCFSHMLDYFENKFTAEWLKIYALADSNMGDLVQWEHPRN